MTTFAGQPQLRQQGRRSATDATVSATAQRLRQFGDGCVMVNLLFVPLTSACFLELGIAVFIACSFLMGLAWAIEHLLEPDHGSGATGAEVIIVLAIGLVCLQLSPLSAGLTQRFIPFSGDFLSLWGTDAGRILGTNPWRTISLTPSLTRSGLMLLLGYSVFFLTLLQRIKSRDDIERVLKLIGIAAIGMAILGLLQLRGNGKFLWLFEHPFRTAAWPAKAAFSNPNHFAQFLALGIGPVIWWWSDCTKQKDRVIRGTVRTTGFGMKHSTESARRYLSIALAIIILAAILSVSRGGLMAFSVAMLIALRVIYKEWKHLFKLAIPTIAFVGLAVWLAGTEFLEQKLDTIRRAGSLQELLQGRYALWTAICDAIPYFSIAGSGLGSHAEIYPTWMSHDFGVRFSHAESGYLQVLLETGAAGLTLVIASIALIGSWAWRAWKLGDEDTRIIVLILVSGIVASLLHSLIDFVWYIPACMIITLTLVACLCRSWQLHRPQKSTPSRRNLWPQCLAVVLIISIIPVGRASANVALKDAESEHDWHMYRKFAIAAGDSTSYESLEALDIKLDAIIMHLENCVATDNADFRAASDLAVMYLRRFERRQQTAENRMSVQEIRDTVRSAEFESLREVAEWLNTAFGSHASDLYRSLNMARRAVRGQPTRGEIYLVLAQVGFLAGISEAEEDALLEQAIKLRPHSAPILFASGLAHVEDGNMEAAFEKWKIAFARDRGIRNLIISGIIPYLSPAEIVDRFSPEPDTLWRMFTEYRMRNQVEHMRFIVDYLDNDFDRFAESANTLEGRFFWQNASEMFQFRGDTQKSLAALIMAVKQHSLNYQLRKKLGLALLGEQRTQEALVQLKWCESRTHDDREITEALESISSEKESEVLYEQP